MSEKTAAAEALAELLNDDQLMHDIGSSFSCGEANVIAEFLGAWAGASASEAWLDLHAIGDNPDDDEHSERGAAVLQRMKATGYARADQGV